MAHNDIMAIAVAVLVFGLVFGGWTICIIIAIKKKHKHKPEDK